ncbi:MAG: LacI family DNA-binding transcriptional regulator [Verrucomicrobia bacterium]|nr:LacI family DNA-binding transcriptional regulator [Verrucomicrobiota bacterium]
MFLSGEGFCRVQPAGGGAQIAARSGVSYQTGSRVINKMPDVTPETGLRVGALGGRRGR